MSILRNSRLWLFFVLPTAAFCFVASLTTSAQILPVISLLVFAGSIGVCVAWAQGFIGFFSRSGAPSTGEILTLGIFLTWALSAFFGAWSFTWRVAGQPMWMANNDVIAFARYTSFLTSLLHLVSAKAIEERIPNARWLRIGGITAVLLSIFCLTCYYLELYKELPALTRLQDE